MADHATETAALVTLLRSGSRPWRQYSELVEEAGTAVAVLAEEQAFRLFTGDGGASLGDVRLWEEQGIHLLTVLDPAYPENLKGVHHRPPLLFAIGRLTAGDARAVAVVGARSASPDGLRAAEAIAEHLARAGFTIVSGLAAGIDSAGHTAALRCGGRTVAVIGTGVNRCYPPQHAALQERIGAAGAVVSQFWPDAPPRRSSFPMRNAVISGLALGTVIVEASDSGGTRLQAGLALRQGRPVFLLPSVLKQAWAREMAQAPGTYVVTDPEEVASVVDRLTAADALTG